MTEGINYHTQFMQALRGIKGHHVIAALHTLSNGINWGDCPKELLADEYARGKNEPHLAYRSMIALDLEKLARRAKARQDGNENWRNVE